VSRLKKKKEPEEDELTDEDWNEAEEEEWDD
jgi:hypothetical protein